MKITLEPVEPARRKPLTPKQKAMVMARYNHRCAICREAFSAERPADYDHEIPIEIGGKDEIGNIQPLHRRPCHVAKTKLDIRLIAKSRRIRKKLAGLAKPKKRIASPGFRSDLRKKLNGKTERRIGAARMA